MKFEIILKEVNNFLGIDIRNKTRKRHYVFGRFLFYKLASEMNPFATLTEIGYFLKKNHATVLYGKKEINNIIQYKQDKKLIQAYNTLIVKLKNMKYIATDIGSIRTKMFVDNQKNMREYYAK